MVSGIHSQTAYELLIESCEYYFCCNPYALMVMTRLRQLSSHACVQSMSKSYLRTRLQQQKLHIYIFIHIHTHSQCLLSTLSMFVAAAGFSLAPSAVTFTRMFITTHAVTRLNYYKMPTGHYLRHRITWGRFQPMRGVVTYKIPSLISWEWSQDDELKKPHKKTKQNKTNKTTKKQNKKQPGSRHLLS